MAAPGGAGSGLSSQVILSPDIVFLWRGQTPRPTGLRTPSATFLPRLARRGLNDSARFAGFRSLPLILAPMGTRPGPSTTDLELSCKPPAIPASQVPSSACPQFVFVRALPI